MQLRLHLRSEHKSSYQHHLDPYITLQDLNRRTFILFAYIFNFFTPMILITVFYSNIVRAVVAHEAALRAQAKKMNVDSLRSGAKEDEDSAEVKIAKVAITNVLLWICIWTPYAAISAFPALGAGEYVTPLVSQIPSFMGKLSQLQHQLLTMQCHLAFELYELSSLPQLPPV